MKFVENDHTTHVLLCSQVFQQLQGNHAANSHEITLQYLVSTAAYLYEHPDAANDSLAQNLAGINAALDVYGPFFSSDGKSHYKFLDTLAKQRADGKLKESLANLCK